MQAVRRGVGGPGRVQAVRRGVGGPWEGVGCQEGGRGPWEGAGCQEGVGVPGRVQAARRVVGGPWEGAGRQEGGRGAWEGAGCQDGVRMGLFHGRICLGRTHISEYQRQDSGHLVRPCLTSLGLVEAVHGHHSTMLIGHLHLINQYDPTFNVAGTS